MQSKQLDLSQQAESNCFEADCILFGFSNQENIEYAISLYQKSAELGNSKAMMALGRIYEQGIGGAKDYEKACHFYHLAADKNEPYALVWMGKQWEVLPQSS